MKKIISDCKIQGGKPVIKGTRVTVKSILIYLSDGISVEHLSERYRKNGLEISVDDINQALIFSSNEVERTYVN